MANNIKDKRKLYGMSLQELANKVKAGKTTISDIESGRHIPNVYVAIRIAHALKTNVENLFWEGRENE